MASTPRQPQAITGAYPEASRGFLWGMGVSIVVHVAVVLLINWLRLFEVSTEAIVQKPEDQFVPVGLVIKQDKVNREQTPQNPNGPNSKLNPRPDARFSNPDNLTKKRSEVPNMAPVPTKVAGGSQKTIGPGSVNPVFNAGNGGRFVAPSAIQNGGTVGSKSRGMGNGNAKFFSITDSGKQIVYAVDRSGSMNSNDEISVAKQELIASLNGLTPEHRFLVLFYDENVFAMTIETQNGREVNLIRASARNLAKIKTRITGIRVKGNTNHMKALRAAMQLKPEAIFFLTDARSALSPREVDLLVRMNKQQRTRIHCIQFGKGAELNEGQNFLKQLATQTKGSYRYRDVLKFRRR